MITGKKHLKCGLLGKKLSHSFSPKIHGELADYSYSLIELSEDEVGRFLKGGNFDALNVTIPYKKTVMPYLDEISDKARRIGAVNTITKTKSGTLRGDNTDYYGFWHTVETSGIAIKNQKVLILGTGGASLTAKTVCEDMGAEEITFVSRSGETNYENVYEKCADTEVIINCTPVGMYPKNGISPIVLEKFKNCKGVIDMIYNPAKTELLISAEKLRIKCVNGLTMLVAQAKKACELFLDQKISDDEIGKITDLIAHQMQNIILVGMPGCGKTTVGQLLSELTGRKVVDTDFMITEKHGRTPAEIIKTDGEEAFRIIESEAVSEAGKMSGVIIATGGGAVTKDINKNPLCQNGKIIFINRSLKALDIFDRPLSKNLEALYEKRLPLYRKFCDFEVSNDSSPKLCAQTILERFKNVK